MLDDRRSQWTAKLPFGATARWTAEITEDRSDEVLAWWSTEDSPIDVRGRVTFTKTVGRDMTEDGFGIEYLHDKVLQTLKLQMDRPIAVRDAIMACRNGGIVSILGVYAGLVDKFPLGALMNRGLTIKTRQCHVRYMKPLLEHIERGDIDPSFVVSHYRNLDDAPKGYDLFMTKQDDVMKIILRA